MRKAIVKDGKVVNVIKAGKDFKLPAEYGKLVDDGEGCAIGSSHDNTGFTPVVDTPPPPPDPLESSEFLKSILEKINNLEEKIKKLETAS